MSKKSENKNIIAQLISFSTGIIVGLGSIYTLGTELIKKLDFLPFLLIYLATFFCLFFVYFINIIFHEFGHMICGFMSGYKFVSYRVMSFTIAKYSDGIKIKKFNLPGTGGQCVLEPPAYNDGKFPYKLYLAGGVIADLVLMILFLIPVFIKGTETYILRFCLIGAVISFLLALINGIPFSKGQVPNDGYDIISMKKNPLNKKLFWLSLDYNAKTQMGMSPIDFESKIQDLDSVINENKDNKYVPSLISIKLNILYEKQEFEQAYKLLEDTLADESLIKIYKNEFLCEKLFMSIMLSKSAEEIESQYTEELRKYINLTHSYMSGRVLLMYAYYKLYKKDEVAAEKEVQAFEKMKNTYVNLGEIALSEKLFKMI